MKSIKIIFIAILVAVLIVLSQLVTIIVMGEIYKNKPDIIYMDRETIIHEKPIIYHTTKEVTKKVINEQVIVGDKQMTCIGQKDNIYMSCYKEKTE